MSNDSFNISIGSFHTTITNYVAIYFMEWISKIIEVYVKESIVISDDTIIVTIPFNRINEVGNKVGDKNLNISQIKVLAEIRNNPIFL